MNKFDFSKEFIFFNKRVEIRPLEENDYLLLQPLLLESSVLLQYSPSEIYLPEKLKSYLHAACQSRNNQQRYPFIIYDNKLNKYAGSTSIGNVSNPD